MATNGDRVDEILKQINSASYQGVQGVNPAAITSLTQSERDKLENELIDALANGNVGAAQPLGLLATASSVAALMDRLNHHKPPSRDHAEIAAALWMATKDIQWQAALLLDMAAPNHLERLSVLAKLFRTPPTDEAFRSYQHFMQHDVRGVVRATAAVGALYIKGLIVDPFALSHPYRDLVRAVGSDRFDERSAALDTLNQLLK